jgi:hypothetical protein
MGTKKKELRFDIRTSQVTQQMSANFLNDLNEIAETTSFPKNGD